MPGDPIKKTTVKLLKKGKINFDGANSEYEVQELYYWLEYIYTKYITCYCSKHSCFCIY